MAAVQRNAVFDPAAIAPLADKASKGFIEEFVFWLERFWRMLSMKYAQAYAGGAVKVAETFRSRLESDLICHSSHKKSGKHADAHDILYNAAYDITWLHVSHINELQKHLMPKHDMSINIHLLKTLKRAELITQLPSLRIALQQLIAGFKSKVDTLPLPGVAEDHGAQPSENFSPAIVQKETVPVVNASLPRATGSRAREGIPIAVIYVVDPNKKPLEGEEEVEEVFYLYPLPELDAATKKAASEMPSPQQRADNDLRTLPLLNYEKPLKSDFELHLNTPNPEYSAVKALAGLLDRVSEEKAARLLKGLSLMSQLYLYEVVTDTHHVFLLNHIANHYQAMKVQEEGQKSIFRAYLELHHSSELVGVRYAALLTKIKELTWPPIPDLSS